MPIIHNEQFLIDKGVKSYIDDLPDAFKENRLCYGKIKRTTGEQIEHEFVVAEDGKENQLPTINVGNKIVMPSSLFWDDMYGILLCSKSFDDEKPDQELLKQAKLPPWMKIDTLYLFKWEKEGDTTKFIKEYEAKDFLMVEPMPLDGMKGKYNFRIEMRDVIEFVGVEFAIECENWVKSLRCAKRCGDENEKSHLNGIKRNIDFLIGMYRRKLGEDVKKFINIEIDRYIEVMDVKKTDIPTFLERMQKAYDHEALTLDAIQSFRPFFREVFKLYMQTFHLKFTDFASQYWNKKYKKFAGNEIMSFLDILYQQEQMINSYGMTDPRYFNSYNELSGTFCVRTFANMMPLILQVLEKMQTEFYKERDTICCSHGPVDLFRFINEVFDCYDFCQQIDVCKSLLSLIFKMVSTFQTEFKKVVLEAEDMSIEVFCALTNSNMKFMSAVRQFMDRVKTNTGMEIPEIQQALTYQMIIKNFAQISNSSFIRIQELMTYNLNHFFSQIKDHKTFQIEKFLTEIIEGIGPVFQMLVKAYSKKLWKHIHDTFSSLFIQFIITFSVKYKQTEQKQFTEKLEKEIEIINDFFDGKAGKKDYKENVQKLDDLYQCLVAPSDKVIVNILNLQIKLRDKFNEKCMKCLMRLRSDITEKQKKRIYRLIQEEEDRISAINRKNLGKMLYRGIMTEFRIHQFVQKFRERKRIRDANKKKKAQIQKDQTVMHINDNERLEVEEAAIGMRGMLKWCTKKLKKGEDPEELIYKAANFKYQTSHFSFLNELFLWKETASSHDHLGRVYILSIDKIGVGMGEEFYFVSFKLFLRDFGKIFEKLKN